MSLLAVDRDPDVVWVVPQPCRLRYRPKAGRVRPHVPDLLVQLGDGSIVLWDARPEEQRDPKFEEAASVTAKACAEVGWSHKIFTGHDPALRYALRWLSAYRMPRLWHPPATALLRELLAGGGSVATVLEADRGGGHLVQTMWHLLWRGELTADLTEPITVATALALAEPTIEAQESGDR